MKPCETVWNHKNSYTGYTTTPYKNDRVLNIYTVLFYIVH